MNIAFSGHETSDGYLLPALVIPGASQEKIIGIHDGRLKLSVQAAPEKGKANKAVVSFLARILEVRKQQLTIVRGETDRHKDIVISDVVPDEIVKKLAPYF